MTVNQMLDCLVQEISPCLPAVPGCPFRESYWRHCCGNSRNHLCSPCSGSLTHLISYVAPVCQQADSLRDTHSPFSSAYHHNEMPSVQSSNLATHGIWGKLPRTAHCWLSLFCFPGNKETPVPKAGVSWYTDCSYLKYENGKYTAAYVITNLFEVIEAGHLADVTSAHQAELCVLTRDCVQAKGLIENIYTDSRHTCGIAHSLECFGSREDSLLPVGPKLGTVPLS